MIFQEPIAAFDPIYTCGKQIEETIVRHQQLSRKEGKRGKSWERQPNFVVDSR